MALTGLEELVEGTRYRGTLRRHWTDGTEQWSEHKHKQLKEMVTDMQRAMENEDKGVVICFVANARQTNAN